MRMNTTIKLHQMNTFKKHPNKSEINSSEHYIAIAKKLCRKIISNFDHPKISYDEFADNALNDVYIWMTENKFMLGEKPYEQYASIRLIIRMSVIKLIESVDGNINEYASGIREHKTYTRTINNYAYNIINSLESSGNTLLVDNTKLKDYNYIHNISFITPQEKYIYIKKNIEYTNFKIIASELNITLTEAESIFNTTNNNLTGKFK